MAHHLFVSPSGAFLPRWREAFPLARSVALRAVGQHAGPKTLTVWLRPEAGRPLAQQISLIQAGIGHVPVIVLSDRPSEEEALDAFAAGAKGYCNSHATAALLKQIDTVVGNGGLWIGESLMHRLVGAVSRAHGTPPPESANLHTVLTDREYEVAEAVSTGASNKEVAQRLRITERTVKAHIGSAFEKLHVRDRLHLALLFNNNGAGKEMSK